MPHDSGRAESARRSMNAETATPAEWEAAKAWTRLYPSTRYDIPQKQADAFMEWALDLMQRIDAERQEAGER